MRRRERLDQLRRVAKINGLKHAHAEHRAARAAFEVRLAQEEQARRTGALYQAASAWDDVLKEPSLELVSLAARSVELTRCSEHVDVATQALDAARDNQRHARDRWQRASAAAEVSDRVSALADRRALSDREEMLLQDITDLRSGSGWFRADR